MISIEMDYLKEKVESRLREEHQNRNRREDLYELDQQISGLHSTFELINSAQEKELRRPVKEAMAKLDNCMTIKS
ncbi:hypothetical protein E5329_26330 [Petralouisia muris]|jgi:hypothetical protein|uniref:Uncharacterized protein n=1 Tax=Petralouisia muris TaxID=3032872 RepID=A0AC61RMZ3_9FIRM|nr:hypothetical protein [Petralouisia muris]TGY87745.1 hypothetical protein E5329_26330 [Petralouisia muris]